MFLNDRPTTTITDLRDRLDQRIETIEVVLSQISVDLTEGMTIKVKNRELPVTDMSIDAICGAIQMPVAFRRRLPGALAQSVINSLLERMSHVDALVRLNDEWIYSIQERGARVIDPSKIVDIAARVLSPTALVDRWVNTTTQFGFDVLVPEGFDRGIGGDLKVGDITCGGLRFAQNVKQNLAPEVSSLLYRLICTNGMEIPNEHFKVDARGATVEMILDNLEKMAEAAFSEVEEQIRHFYAMREQIVAHPERTISRMARDNKLSERLRIRLIDAVPQADASGPNGEVTMFDLVNLVTNTANDPEIPRGAAPILQRFGGNLTHVHGNRCRTCAGALN